MTKQVVFLMSDTGGGHRAAAEAIREALYAKYGYEQVNVKMIDVYRRCRWPVNKFPEFYPWIVNRSATLWGIGYHLANIKPIYAFNKRYMYISNRSRLQNMVSENPADVVVSVHSVITPPAMYAYQSQGERPPFITVVTDLVSTPRYWYDHRADITFVPTQAAYERGIENGLMPEQMEVVGLPVHPKFATERETAEVRQEFGWDPDLPTVMLIAGGDGMGPLLETAESINDAQLNCQLVIVAGKNEALKAKLETVEWNQPTHIYGYVRDMPDKMRGADILVTKAGPATISEAFLVGLPVILSDMIPGQEAGNVSHVVENGAGVYANTPRKVADAVRDWLAEGWQGLEARKDNARRLANPDAVWRIADAIWEYAHKPRIPTGR